MERVEGWIVGASAIIMGQKLSILPSRRKRNRKLCGSKDIWITFRRACSTEYESGSHTELLAENGRYAALLHFQTGDAIDVEASACRRVG